jgi:phosphoesterase RecJ-like protein
VADVLGRAVLDEEAGLVWSLLRPGDLEKAGVGWEAADSLIDLVRLAEEAGVALLLKEVEPGTLKGSLRSRGVVDVAMLAETFAAGFTSHASVDETVAAITEVLI